MISISRQSINSFLTRYQYLSGLIYVALVVTGCLTTLLMVTDTLDHYRARTASLEMLSRLEGRGHGGTKDFRPTGSPFLEGPTVTVAGVPSA